MSLDFYAYAYETMDKGGSATDIGFWISNISTITDLSIVVFEVFHECYLELLLIQLGKITTNSSSSGDLVVKLGVELYEYFTATSGHWHELDGITGLIIDATDNVAVQYWYESIGVKLGQIFSDLFEFNIPVFNINEFEKGGHSLLEH